MDFEALSALQAAVGRECAVQFEALGWKSTGTGSLKPSFTRPGSAEIEYQLDVDWGIGDGVSLMPGVGVRHVTVCELCGRFTGELASGHAAESRDYLSPVFHYALQALMKDRSQRRWWVGALADVAPVVARVRADLLAYGMPFLAGYTTLADVIGFLERHTYRDAYENRSLAIAQALAGRVGDALETLAQFAGAYDATAAALGPYVDRPYYRPFFAGFVAHFNIDPSQVPAQVARFLQSQGRAPSSGG